ncbi:MAG: hypothetical protein P0Y65_14655 [Candidatus Devosia phytovorans]|uniref:Uncharacterized protein n=1 Tax=Candidatus Devosia phytovorans TaxID=3121372 RepID=A0AAJ6B0D7_9HYPH|nr:hypothetical protein [Devosia sp.]WEK03428.1 MAG: hypothetical protein P0Y65_14655 [Devosia sp.]
MKRLLLSLLLATAMASAALAQDVDSFDALSNVEIEAQATDLHPAALYLLSSRLLAEGKGQEAANWMYAGQLRYRFLITAEEDAASAEGPLFGALSEQIGRPVNEYIAGDVDEWLAAMHWALEWDAANDNGVTSKTEHAEALAEVRAGLESLIAQVEDNRETIPQEREANGLENR